MGSVKDYFSSLGKGISSLVKGLEVTGKEFVTPKITEKYPDNRDEMHVAQRFRATLEFIYDEEGNHKCIACGTCERNCPNGTITVETKMVDTWDGKKKKKLDRYIYDLGSCTFCQLCVTTCPTNAIRFSNDFEQAVFTREKLVKQLNYLPEKPEPKPTPEQIAKLEAEKKAKKKAQHHAAPLSGISAIDYTTEYSDWLMPTPPTNAIPIVAEEPEEPEIENHKEPEKSHANPNIPEQMELFS